MIRTTAWIITEAEHGPLEEAEYAFPEPEGDEVLAAPLFGCWEGNMGHAVKREPLNLCKARGEPQVVLGNAGVVRILDVPQGHSNLKAGDVCLLFCNGVADAFGYPKLIYGYDAPKTIGVLAKTIKLRPEQLIKLPTPLKYSLPQWAAFSLRYITAWANWRVALQCWQSQMPECLPAQAFVAGWGGGVSMAELSLASMHGCKTLMTASGKDRMAVLRAHGIDGFDRSAVPSSEFEKAFLSDLKEKSSGLGASIFVDNLGGALYRITLAALARQGVVTSSGWKCGIMTPSARAIECISRHIHVHTHYARYQEGLDAVAFAQTSGWMPPGPERIYEWHEIPELMAQYESGDISSYFPVFRVNPEGVG